MGVRGDGPARVMRGGPEPPLLLEIVHLDHHPVGVVVERVPIGLEATAVRRDLVQGRGALRPGIHREAALPERLEPFPLRVEARRLEHAHVVEEDLEGARGGHRRILLAHRARRRVPGVGEDGLARFLQPRVEAGKGPARHVDLTAHLELDRALEGPRERGRDGLDRAQVLGDVLADAPVAARGAADEAPTLVEQRHPESVDLGLADVCRGEAGLRPPDPRLELLELLHGHRVVQRQHRDEVLDRGEGLRPPPARPLGRAVGGDQLRVRLLERHQLAPEPVVLGVADLGAVLRVVEVVVPVELRQSWRVPE